MKKKILVILLILVFFYCIGGVIYSIFVNQKTTDDENIILNINNYNYSIVENKVTDLYKQEFNILKNILESEETDYLKYAESIAKLYIIDLYTLNIKANKYDVTSSQYVYSSSMENFKIKVCETLYKYIEDNSSEKRKQELPEVNEINILNFEETTYMINEQEYNAYKVQLSWNYKKDLGYDKDAVLILINDNKIISVVEQNKIN